MVFLIGFSTGVAALMESRVWRSRSRCLFEDDFDLFYVLMLAAGFTVDDDEVGVLPGAIEPILACWAEVVAPLRVRS